MSIQTLRAARIDAGVSQIELAQRMGIEQNEVSKIERGVRRLDLAEALMWIQALGLDRVEFLTSLMQGFDALRASDDAVRGGASGIKAPSSEAAPYRDPHTGRTWSGRGRMPLWLKTAIAQGKALADFFSEP